MRVLYAAVVPDGATDHMPSVPSGALFVYAVAVPETKYSACSYPTDARSNVVDGRNTPSGLVIGPSMVGLGTCASAMPAKQRTATTRAKRGMRADMREPP